MTTKPASVLNVEKAGPGICNACAGFYHLVAISLPQSYAATWLCYVCARGIVARVTAFLDDGEPPRI